MPTTHFPLTKRHRIPKHKRIQDYPLHKKHRRAGWVWMFAALVLLASSILIASKARATTDTLSAGRLTFQEAQSGQPSSHDALLLDTHIDAEITGLVAQVRYEQSFSNNSEDWQEAIYQFPLPETAGINHMEIQIGDRTIIGKIKEKQAAKRIYQEAVRSGKRAALTEQQRPNMFTQKIGNIAPGETIIVRLQYLQKIDFKHHQFEWRLPTTFTPRYIPGKPVTPPQLDTMHSALVENIHPQEAFDRIANEESHTNYFGWASATDQVPDAHQITPLMSPHTQHQFSLNIRLNAGLPLAKINAPYHDIDIAKQNTVHSVSLMAGYADMNRDFVLNWSPVLSQLPSAAIFSEQVDGEFYSLLMLLPPEGAHHSAPSSQEKNQHEALNRDITFIIDTSGSMQGPSINQAKQGLLIALNQLNENDRFNIIEFNSQHSTLFSQLQAASESNIQQANQWVRQLHAEGGTEMYSALDTAFHLMPDNQQLQQIVFITDGAIGNEQALFDLIHKRLENKRLFTVGIGSAPNSYFMRKAAQFGRGTFSHIGDVNEVQEKMAQLFEKLNRASSTNIKIDWQQNVEQYPQHIGELYLKEALIVSAKSDQPLNEIYVSGSSSKTPWQRNIRANTSAKQTGVSTLWAREKIAHIEDQNRMGLIHDASAKTDIINIALTHKLVSRFTSFVATEKTPARPQHQAVKKRAIANNIAKGQNKMPVMMPNTATTAEISWWLGLFGFIAFIVIKRMKEDEQ